ncbi:MAG: hypothetical protein ACRES3_05520, partial [Steroidobacteraceae bacterium]
MKLRPQSLSGLLSAALLLIVLPLTAALVYGGVQLRQLSRTSEVLVRDSIALTEHTQQLFQDINAMERAANLYGVMNDPSLAVRFDSNYVAFTRTLAKVGDYVTAEDIGRVRAAGEATVALVQAGQPDPVSSGRAGRFNVLSVEANRLAEQARLGIDS